jgi:hypothetical protein
MKGGLPYEGQQRSKVEIEPSGWRAIVVREVLREMKTYAYSTFQRGNRWVHVVAPAVKRDYLIIGRKERGIPKCEVSYY